MLITEVPCPLDPLVHWPVGPLYDHLMEWLSSLALDIQHKKVDKLSIEHMFLLICWLHFKLLVFPQHKVVCLLNSARDQTPPTRATATIIVFVVNLLLLYSSWPPLKYIIIVIGRLQTRVSLQDYLFIIGPLRANAPRSPRPLVIGTLSCWIPASERANSQALTTFFLKRIIALLRWCALTRR